MFCTHCGAEANEPGRFCRICGQQLDQTAEIAASSEPIPAGGQPGPSWSGQPRLTPTIAAGSARASHPSVRFLADGATEIAPTGRRIGAFAIDIALMVVAWLGVAIVIGIVYFTVNGIPDGNVVPVEDEETIGFLIWAIASPVIFIGAWLANATGGSAGKRILGLRIVRVDGKPPGIGWGLGRTITAWLSWAAIGLGYLWGTWDDRGQTWHDKMAGTYVVRADTLVVPPSAGAQRGSLH